MRQPTHPGRHEGMRKAVARLGCFDSAARRNLSQQRFPQKGNDRGNGSEMKLLSMNCHLCGGSSFRADPPDGWLETELLPRLFIRPGRCTACLTRRYRPLFYKWDKTKATWP